MERLEKLLEFYKKDPKDPFILYGIALEYMSIKNYEEAEVYFKKILEADSNYVPAYMQYAQLKTDLNEIPEAKKLYEQGIKIAKQTGENHAANEMEDFLDELG